MKLSREQLVLFTIILCILPLAISLAQEQAEDQKTIATHVNKADVVPADFTRIIADYHCKYVYGDMNLWKILTYYDSNDLPAVYVYIYTYDDTSNINDIALMKDIKKYRNLFNKAVNLIKEKGKSNSNVLVENRKLLRVNLTKIKNEDRFVSIYVSATRTHSPVIEWRRGLPESITFRSEFRDWFQEETNMKPEVEKFYYFGPQNIAYNAKAAGLERIYFCTDSGSQLKVKRSQLKKISFRRDYSRISPSDKRAVASIQEIDKEWKFFDRLINTNTLPSGIATTPAYNKLNDVPDFIQQEFGNIFPAYKCCVVMAFGDIAGYWDTNNYAGITYWNLFPATWQMGSKTYPLGGFWQDQGNLAVDNTLYQLALEMQYDFNNGGVTHQSCLDPWDVRFEGFTNSSPGRYLSFDTVEDCWFGPAWWTTIQDELNNNRPMVLVTTAYSWTSDPGPYPNLDGHAVVMYGYDTAKSGYTQAVCVHVNGSGTPGDVWWDYADMVNCLTWRIYPGGNPGEFLHAPITTYPSNGGNITDSTPRLDWNARSGAPMYSVQLSAHSNFSDLIVNDVTSNTSFDVPALSCGTYYWRVATHNSKGYICEYHDPPKTFTVVPPASPDLNKPIDAVCSGVSYTVSWSSVSGANNYTPSAIQLLAQ